jgi:exodeoxyribonuclease V gamma subunit
MLKIIQSQRIESLFDEMLAFFDEHPIGVFEPRQILIPSHGVGVWLKYHLASTQGIVAQVSTDFMGAFQWDLYGRLAERDAEQKLINGAPQAPLSASIMRWQIFAYIWQVYNQAFSTQDSQKNTNQEKTASPEKDMAAIHALGFLLKKIVSQQHHTLNSTQQADNDAEVKRTIWVLSSQIAQVFAGYVTYRSDWLRLWGRGEFLNLKVLCKDKPDWLIERYSEMQLWQAWLWKTLFTSVFDQREAEVSRFWSALKTDPSLVKKLPRSVTIFTVIQLPPAELMFLRQLAQYVDVALLHYNPSQEYWADLVDARWLQRRQSEQGEGVELRETHPLLTRMGKQSRDVFKLLVQLSGGEFVEGESFQGVQAFSVQESWQDAFVQIEHEQLPTVLRHIQQHALDLSNVKNWDFDPKDDSLAIHACHSTLRQLEVLREEIIQWLGTDVPENERRKPSDILVLIPDLNDVAPLIRAVFPSSISYDPRADALVETHVPIEITGLTSPEVDALWQALTGRFSLLVGRLSCETLLDWLALQPVQQSYGLSVEQVTRMGELLVEAGFRRGFDGEHLSRTLLSHDADVRFTLRFALDRLILGMAMPVDTMYVDCLPMTTLMRDDFELVAILEQMYQELNAHRGQLLLQRHVSEWLAILRTELQQIFAAERDTRGWTSITQALDDMEKNANSALLAKEKSTENDSAQHEIQLPLRFVLEELQTTLTQAMQSSIPTGSVTFARLGTMRPLPYRLIAVLNLDTGKFPQREQKNTFDLIGALPPVIGDRARTEDDLGAFLDALLLASEACWLFYNGRDVQDDQPRLPAAPVQELMDFLRDHLAKVPSVIDESQSVSPLDRSIHHSHTLLPFERENFNANTPQASSGVWFEVAKRLNQEQSTHSPAWISPSAATIYSVPESPIKADQWIKDLMQPARHFLAHARIGRLYLEEGLSPFEPLTLNKLDEYQLRHQFQLSKQNQKSLQSTQWIAALPVGVAGAAYWKKSEREQVLIEQRMQQYGGVVTPVTERLLTIPDAEWLDDQVVQNWQLSIRVPTDEKATIWLSQSASSGKGRHRVRFWLEHLLWQVWRKTTEDDVAQGRGYRISVYSTQTLKALPIAAGDALKHVQNWLQVWQIAAQQPFVLPPSLTLEAFSVDKKTDELKIKSFDTLSVKWLGNDFNSYIPPNQNEECALHPDWQLILQGQDVEEAYAHFFTLYAETLYESIVRNVLDEDDATQEKAE